MIDYLYRKIYRKLSNNLRNTNDIIILRVINRPTSKILVGRAQLGTLSAAHKLLGLCDAM